MSKPREWVVIQHSHCCDAEVKSASVSNGWIYRQCQKCYDRCSIYMTDGITQVTIA